MIWRQGDRIIIKWRGTSVPGWVRLASENQKSLAVCWDAMKHEVMIAGHIGMMPLLRDPDGVYRELFEGERVDLEREQ